MGLAEEVAIGPAVTAAMAPLINMIAKSHNTAAIDTAGKVLMPLNDAAGVPLAPGVFPSLSGTVNRCRVAVCDK